MYTTLKILTEFNIICGFRSNMSSPYRKTNNPNPLEISIEDHTNILQKLGCN